MYVSVSQCLCWVLGVLCVRERMQVCVYGLGWFVCGCVTVSVRESVCVMYVCLSVSLSVCLSVMYVCLSVCLSVCV